MSRSIAKPNRRRSRCGARRARSLQAALLATNSDRVVRCRRLHLRDWGGASSRARALALQILRREYNDGSDQGASRTREELRNELQEPKPPFAGPEAVLAYLARYTHRVAISNSRLIVLDERGVTFRYKDYRRNGQARYRTMTLSADEFIRRFLLHVLPKGFHCIRHYGLPASASCKTNRSRRHYRSSPALSLLRRAHDPCRGLCARRRTTRTALRCGDRDLMP
jgi:Putative transposase